MKKNNDMKWLVIGLLILIGFCIFLTALIILHTIKSESVMTTKSSTGESEQIEQSTEVMMDQTVFSLDEDIHVLIKNDTEIFYSELFLLSTGAWYINGQPMEEESAINMLEYMRQRELVTAMVSSSDEVGSVAVVDNEGNIIKEGYTGTLEVRLYDETVGYDGGVVLINILSIEDYVRYVLPSEMPSYFSYEALKAQAVCARTLAVRQRANTLYEKWDANLDDSTDYQVFHENGTNELTDMAVQATEGEVIVYETEPIECCYYSTSAGNSNDMSVWLSENLPYIRQKNFIQFRDADFSDESALLAFLNESPLSYDSDSPFYRWTAELDFSDVVDVQYGCVKGFSVSKTAASGYAFEIKINYENGSCLLGNEYDIRKFLGSALGTLTLADGSVRDNFTVLPSSCFVIESKNGRKYVLRGGGFGHGIGMSQYGASKMAQDGLDYKAILSFYYEGVTIQRLDEIVQN